MQLFGLSADHHPLGFHPFTEQLSEVLPRKRRPILRLEHTTHSGAAKSNRAAYFYRWNLRDYLPNGTESVKLSAGGSLTRTHTHAGDRDKRGGGLVICVFFGEVGLS